MSVQSGNVLDQLNELRKAFSVIGKSEQFPNLLSMIEKEREEAISLGAPNIVSYPLAVRRYDTTQAGNTMIDFVAGKFKQADGVTRTMTGRLKVARSVLLFVADADAIIFLDSKQMINDHALWHLFEDVFVRRIQIRFPSSTNIFPDEFAVAVVASDKPNHSVKNSLFLSHDVHTSPIVLATVASQVTMLRHIAGYDTVVLTTENTDGADSLDLTVEYSADGVIYYPVDTYNPKTIAFGVTDELDILVKYHFLRSSVIRSGASDADFRQIIQVSR